MTAPVSPDVATAPAPTLPPEPPEYTAEELAADDYIIGAENLERRAEYLRALAAGIKTGWRPKRLIVGSTLVTMNGSLADRVAFKAVTGDDQGAAFACIMAVRTFGWGVMIDITASNLRGADLDRAYNDECGRDAAKFVSLIRLLAENGGAR